MVTKIIFVSQTIGIWQRLIARVIGEWLVFSVLIFQDFAPLLKHVEYEIFRVAALAGLVVTGIIVFIMMLQNRPSLWDNQVEVDLEKRHLLVHHGKERLFNGVYPFDKIDAFSVRHLDSFLFKDAYLVKIYWEAEELKLLGFKSPTQYVKFVALLKNEMALKSRADSYFSKNLFWRLVSKED